MVTGLRERGSKRARHHNQRSCALLQLLDQSADIRHALLTGQNLCNLGLVTLWRLRLVSRQWNVWVNMAMRSLPALVVQGGHDCFFALTFAQMRWTALPCPNLAGRQCHAACGTTSGEIVLAGGTERTEVPGSHPLGSRIDATIGNVEVYCGGSWRTVPAMSLPAAVRRACIVCLRDGSLLLLGGADENAAPPFWRLAFAAKRP